VPATSRANPDEPPFRSRVHRPQLEPRASIARRIKLRTPSLSHNCRTRVHGLLHYRTSRGKGVENATFDAAKGSVVEKGVRTPATLR
jgi:hypothetical protein